MPPVPSEARAFVADVDSRGSRHRVPCGPVVMESRTWGAGEPLVLLHGASGSWTHWIRNVLPLAARFRVIVPDMPGFGDSDSPPEPHTADALADLVAAGIEALLPSPARLDIAGFSFGGIIGGLVAARLGRRVRALVLLGSGGLALSYPPPPGLVRIAPADTAAAVRHAHRENLARLMFGDPARIDDLAVLVQGDNVRRARFKTGGIPTSDALSRALPSVEARLAGIWGERDAFVGPHLDERRRLLASFESHVDFRVISGAGHWVTYETADEVNAALLDILR